MKPAPAPSTLVVANADSELPTMTSRVDPEGARRMMEMLVNLYADRRLAVVREYVSNAVDATRAAGGDAPVEITTPTLLEPNFVVTDRGIGMSVEEVEATFLAFAASTKRNTNEQIGGLGVGAKSAWAVTESFLVDTVKDGRRTLVRASRDLSHQVLLAGEPTDLPTGTTISVPVEIGDNSAAWIRIVREVATAHDPGRVIVDGKPVASIAAGPARIGPVLCKRVRDGHGESVLIRSGGTLFSSVPEVTRKVLNATTLNACVIEVPIGSFDHTPSRESIVATDRTMAAITAALDKFRGEFDLLKQRITTLALTDVHAAITLRHSIVGEVAPYTVLPIQLSVTVPGGIGAWKTGRRYSRSKWSRIDGLDRDTFAATSWDEEMERTVVVTDVPKGRALRAFATYLKENRPKVHRVVPIPEGTTAVAFPVTDAKGDPVPSGQTLAFDATMVPEANRFTFAEWTQLTKVQRAERGTVAAGYSCLLVAADGDSPVSITLTAQEIAGYNLPVWYAEGEPPTHRDKAATKASIGVYLGRRKDGPLLAAVPAAMTAEAWVALRFAAQTAGWSETTKLAVAAQSLGSDLNKRFALAAAARDGIAAAGRTSIALIDRIATIHATIATVTPQQAAVWEAGRHSSGYCAAREELYEIDRALRAAYPLLKHAGGYGSRCDDRDYIDYMAAVTPR